MAKDINEQVPAPATGVVTPEQVAAMQARIEELTSLIKGVPASPLIKRVQEHQAKMLFLVDPEGKKETRVVTAFGKSFEKFNEERKTRLYCMVMLRNKDGEEKEEAVDMLDVLQNGTRFAAKIVSKKLIEDKEKYQESQPRPRTTENPDPVGQKSFREREVWLTHHVQRYSYDLKFIEGPWEGMDLTVDENALNP